MKYLLLLPIIALIVSCSDDDSRVIQNENQDLESPFAYPNYLTIDFENLDSYTPVLPEHYSDIINQTNTPSNNPITDAGATLGRVLFYDEALSFNGTVSCASCHNSANGFDDPNRFSSGFEGELTPAHAMRLLNGQFYLGQNFFWDKRAETLEVQTTQPIQNEIEMGFDTSHGGFSALIDKMNELEYYPELFTYVYGDTQITEERVQLALAQFIRAMVSINSQFDSGFAQVYNDALPGNNILANFPNYSVEENLGKQLFISPLAQGGVGCASCHQAPSFALNPNSRSNGLDGGELTIFKSPSLKSAGLSTNFMHDGRFSSLSEVIEHYNSGILVGPALDNRLRAPGGGNNPLRLNLSQEEKDALEAFILTLNDHVIQNDPRFSDPFIN